MTVQYEKLVLQPRRVMASVLRFLGLAWDDAVLRCEVRADTDITRGPSMGHQVQDLYLPIIAHQLGGNTFQPT